MKGCGRKVVATRKLVLIALMALPRPAAGIHAPQAAPSGEPPRLVLEEELRIGSVDDPDYALTKVGDVRIGEGGAIYVWQPMSHRMVVFAPDGKRLHTVGARGAGPGEFVGPARWTWVGDSLAGFDQDQQRYSLFTAGGAHVRTGRILPAGSIGETVLEAVLADGSALGWSRAKREEGLGMPRLRYAASGELLDTLFVAGGTPSWALVHLPRGLVVNFRRPLEEGDLFALDPLGRHVTLLERGAATLPGPHRFRVYRIGIEGDTLFDRRFRYTPRPVGRAWADSVRRAFREEWLSREFRLRSVARLTRPEVDLIEEEGLRLPPFHPPVTDAIVARDGRTWLRLERTTAGLARWMVLDLTGRVAGFVAAPAGLEIRNASEGHVWGVLHDELDVPYVLRYEIRSGEG